MGMDGLLRPGQLLGYTDAIGTHNGAERRALGAKAQYSIGENARVESFDKKPKQEESNKQDPHEPPVDETEDDKNLNQELRALLELHFNLTLDPKMVYRFVLNEPDNKIELKNITEQTTLLTLSVEAFMRLTQTVRNHSGWITDRLA